MVADGHGGAKAAEWLQRNLCGVIEACYKERDVLHSLASVFSEAGEAVSLNAHVVFVPLNLPSSHLSSSRLNHLNSRDY